MWNDSEYLLSAKLFINKSVQCPMNPITNSKPMYGHWHVTVLFIKGKIVLIKTVKNAYQSWTFVWCSVSVKSLCTSRFKSFSYQYTWLKQSSKQHMKGFNKVHNSDELPRCIFQFDFTVYWKSSWITIIWFRELHLWSWTEVHPKNIFFVSQLLSYHSLF